MVYSLYLDGRTLSYKLREWSIPVSSSFRVVSLPLTTNHEV
ncbi:hypothetical protein PSPHG_CDS_0193 [Pseudomonas phage Psxphi15]